MRYLRVTTFANHKRLVGLSLRNNGTLVCDFIGDGFLEVERDIHKFFAVDILFLCLEVEESQMRDSIEFIVVFHGILIIIRR